MKEGCALIIISFILGLRNLSPTIKHLEGNNVNTGALSINSARCKRHLRPVAHSVLQKRPVHTIPKSEKSMFHLPQRVNLLKSFLQIPIDIPEG